MVQKYSQEVVNCLEGSNVVFFLQLCEWVYGIVTHQMIQQAGERGYPIHDKSNLLNNEMRLFLHGLLRIVQYDIQQIGSRLTHLHQDRFGMTCIVGMTE